MDINIVKRADLSVSSEELYIIKSALYVLVNASDVSKKDKEVALNLHNEIHVAA